MEPTSHQPFSGLSDGTASAAGSAHSSLTSPVDPDFSTTAAHATGDEPTPVAGASQPAAAGLKGKLDTAVESGKKWLSDSGVADQAQQLPQKAKDLGNQAWTSISGLTTTQKAVGVGLLAAGVAFLAVRSKGKKEAPEYRDRPRKSPFDHQPHTKDGDHAYDRRGQRPWGASRYGAAPTPTGKARVSSGSGYSSSPAAPSADLGRSTSSDRSTSVGGGSYSPGQRRDQGPAASSKYDANTSGGQNPNNLDQLTSVH